MIIIPEQIHSHENRQNDISYSRSGQFLEDFNSQVWLEIGTRWFNLANFTELVHDTEKFFRTIMMPNIGLRAHDRDGHIMPMHFMDEQKYLISPMCFESDNIVEHYERFDYKKAEVWRRYAAANLNQQFK